MTCVGYYEKEPPKYGNSVEKTCTTSCEYAANNITKRIGMYGYFHNAQSIAEHVESI